MSVINRKYLHLPNRLCGKTALNINGMCLFFKTIRNMTLWDVDEHLAELTEPVIRGLDDILRDLFPMYTRVQFSHNGNFTLHSVRGEWCLFEQIEHLCNKHDNPQRVGIWPSYVKVHRSACKGCSLQDYIISTHKHVDYFNQHPIFFLYEEKHLNETLKLDETVYYHCQDGGLIVMSHVCNGIADCMDTSDEENCSAICYYSNMWYCMW